MRFTFSLGLTAGLTVGLLGGAYTSILLNGKKDRKTIIENALIGMSAGLFSLAGIYIVFLSVKLVKVIDNRLILESLLIQKERMILLDMQTPY